MPEKKIGRPTNNPKTKRLNIRFDDKSIEIVEQYSKKKNVSKAEAVRRGIAKLEDDLKE